MPAPFAPWLAVLQGCVAGLCRCPVLLGYVAALLSEAVLTGFVVSGRLASQ